MTADQIDSLSEEVRAALLEAANVARERDLYERVLKQAVMTHDGCLRISLGFAEDAKNDKRKLFIGGGNVTLE